eukprot:gene19492-19919_t
MSNHDSHFLSGQEADMDGEIYSPTVDLDGIRAHVAPFYSPIGRPSIDPELLIRMLLVGYCFGIRSERRLCEEVHLNLGYRWFCRLGLDGDVPDHSTFSTIAENVEFDPVPGAGIDDPAIGREIEGDLNKAAIVLEADVAEHADGGPAGDCSADQGPF